jgi:hypothetical protein
MDTMLKEMAGAVDQYAGAAKPAPVEAAAPDDPHPAPESGEKAAVRPR